MPTVVEEKKQEDPVWSPAGIIEECASFSSLARPANGPVYCPVTAHNQGVESVNAIQDKITCDDIKVIRKGGEIFKNVSKADEKKVDTSSRNVVKTLDYAKTMTYDESCEKSPDKEAPVADGLSTLQDVGRPTKDKGGGVTVYEEKMADSSDDLVIEAIVPSKELMASIGAGVEELSLEVGIPTSISTEDKTTVIKAVKEEEMDLAAPCDSSGGLVDKNDIVPFLDLVKQTVRNNEGTVFATWYGSNGEATEEYTFGQLWDEAGVIAHYLRINWSVEKGDRVVLCYNFGLHFFAAFLGCLRAGAVAVLVYPPMRPLTRSLPKMSKVVQDCDAKIVLMDRDVELLKTADKMNPLSQSRQLWPKLKYKVTTKLKRFCGKGNDKVLRQFDETVSPSDLAFLQYTSGSTGEPKGVMVTFGSLSANVRLIHNGYRKMMSECGHTGEFVGFSWLPQYHDLGLIFTCIAPFAAGNRQHMMSPLTFVQKPILWLELMSRLGVHWGASPDFGYRLAARKFLEAKDRLNGQEPIPNLDLSSVVQLIAGAEPIRSDTIKQFEKVFRDYGLRDNWVEGGYGLAEHVVSATWITGMHLSKPNPNDGTQLVACGSRQNFGNDILVKIVSPESYEEVNDGNTGEIWISSPSVAAGYFGKHDLSKETFGARIVRSPLACTFLRTGDLGFFQGDKLFICGRAKDVIIYDGVNYYPQDIEFAVEQASSAVRQGCVAAFSSNEVDRDGDLQVVFEIRSEKQADASETIKAVRSSILEKVGLVPSQIVAIKAKSIPKTTSGKIRRKETRLALQSQLLPIVEQWSRPSKVTNSDLSTSSESELSAPNVESLQLKLREAPSSKHFEDRVLDSDVLVVGAGILGLCFARDIASLGYKVTVVEKSPQIGGVWANNDYPGLRLHSPGMAYRCLTVAPKWNHDHEFKELYRPTRDEILEYCHVVSKHENISILLQKECDYKNKQIKDKMVLVKVGNKMHRTRFLFASGNLSLTYSGTPTLPISLNDDEYCHLASKGPMCLHSSQLSKDRFDWVRRTPGHVYIVGSGKAALDILQNFDPKADSVTWAHRGHTLFQRRDLVETAYHKKDGAGYQGQIVDYVKEAALEGQGRHWSALAVEAGYLCCCEGPLTSRKVKYAQAVCSQDEIEHANSFPQLQIQSVARSGDNVKLVSGISGEEDLLVGRNDCVIFCTGQRNKDWSPPRFEESYAQSGPHSRLSCPLCALVPLRLAVEQLRGSSALAAKVQKIYDTLNPAMAAAIARHDDPRELDHLVHDSLKGVSRVVFGAVHGDIAFRREWGDDWYRKDVPVDEAFAAFCSNTASKSIGGTTTIENPAIQKTQRRDIQFCTSEIVSSVASVLGIEEDTINPDALLLETGLSSLVIPELLEAIETKFQVQLSPVDLYDCPTIAGLAHVVMDKQQAGGGLDSKVTELVLPSTEWFVPKRRKTLTSPEDAILLFVFPGVAGDQYTFQDFARELPDCIVPYVVRFPWATERADALTTANAVQFVDCIAREIADKFSGFPFAFLGHSAGGLLAYLVAKRLREEDFDMAPMLNIPVNSPPPSCATSWKLSQAVLKVCLGASRDQPKLVEHLKKDILSHAKFWRSVHKTAASLWQKDPGIDGPLFVVGGDQDSIVSPSMILGWSNARKSEDISTTIFGGGDHFFPAFRAGILANERAFKQFWARTGEELLRRKALAGPEVNCFGPIRSALQIMNPVEYDLMMVSALGLSTIVGTLHFEGHVDVEEILKRAKTEIPSDKRFLRFHSRPVASEKRWKIIDNWEPHDNISSSDVDISQMHGKSPWHIQLIFEENTTKFIFKCHHAIGDGFVVREFLMKGFGSVTGRPNFPSKPAFGSKSIRRLFDAKLQRVAQKHPLPKQLPISVAADISKVVPIELSRLSLDAVRKFGRKKNATVNDVLLMLVSEVKRRMGEPHEWLYCTTNNRTETNWNQLQNVSGGFPVYVGAGQIATIRQYTRAWKIRQFLSSDTEVAGQSRFMYSKDMINGLSNVVGFFEHHRLNGHSNTSLRYHAVFPGIVWAISLVDVLDCTLTIEEVNRHKITAVQEAWFCVADELGMIDPSSMRPKNDSDIPQCLVSGLGLVGHRSARDQITLHDFTQYHGMDTSLDVAERCTRVFDGGILLLPHQYDRNAETLCRSISDFSLVQYQKMVRDTFTGLSTKSGETKFLVSRDDLADDVQDTITAEYDKSLVADPCVFEAIKKRTNSCSLRLLRRFEYYFGGNASLSVMMLHVEAVDNGVLTLVEIYRKGSERDGIEGNCSKPVAVPMGTEN